MPSQTASPSGGTVTPSAGGPSSTRAVGSMAITALLLPYRIVAAMLAFAIYHVYKPAYVIYCTYLRSFPIPDGACVEATLPPAGGSGGAVRPCNGPFSSAAVDGDAGAHGGNGVVGSIHTILDGSQLAHNTHLTCVRNRVVNTNTSGGGDDGGGFFLVSEEEAESGFGGGREHGHSTHATTKDTSAAADGIIFESLEDAILHAHRTSLLLVVYLHAETSAVSQCLLRELIVHNTNNIQHFLSNNVVFYLLSIHSEEASGLLQTVVLGQSLPAILVFNANQPAAILSQGSSTSSSAAALSASSSSSPHAASSSSYLRFVSSMEGCGCVGDLLPYLRECEKRYMSWM